MQMHEHHQPAASTTQRRLLRQPPEVAGQNALKVDDASPLAQKRRALTSRNAFLQIHCI